jgi:hypothetical protein
MLISLIEMRILLVICLLGMTLLGGLYLRQRDLTLSEYISWGLLLVFIPLLGPFLVILSRPGKSSAIEGLNGQRR